MPLLVLVLVFVFVFVFVFVLVATVLVGIGLRNRVIGRWLLNRRSPKVIGDVAAA